MSRLIAREMVQEQVPLDGSPGRPAALLSVNPAIARVVGMDIGGRHSRAVLTDAAGTILTSVVQETRVTPDADAIVDDLVQLLVQVCGSAECLASLAAVGVGIQGIVNTRTGTVLDWPNTPMWIDGWRGLNVPAILASRLDVSPVVIDDSVRAMAETARRFGQAQNVPNFLYVFLGNGIGSGIIADGRLYAGSIGVAGELGHVTVDEEGPWCSCGNRGCLEVMASTAAVLRRAHERLTERRLMSALHDPHDRGSLTLATMIEAAHNGDKLAYQILDETGSYIGTVLAIALNILGSEMVVLAGPLAQAQDIILEAVERQVRLRALPHISQQVAIICDDQGEMTGAQGAALRALDTLFGASEHLARLAAQFGLR